MFTRYLIFTAVVFATVLDSTETFAQLGQSIRDLQVKSITIYRRSGSSWVPTNSVASGQQYKMEVRFGNPGMISFPEERYKKINIDIRLVFKGFRIVNSYLHRDNIRFYTDNTFSTVSSSTRATFDLSVLKTTDADVQFTTYIKFTGSITSMVTNSMKWDCGIYGYVYDKVWREEGTN